MRSQWKIWLRVWLWLCCSFSSYASANRGAAWGRGRGRSFDWHLSPASIVAAAAAAAQSCNRVCFSFPFFFFWRFVLYFLSVFGFSLFGFVFCISYILVAAGWRRRRTRLNVLENLAQGCHKSSRASKMSNCGNTVEVEIEIEAAKRQYTRVVAFKSL